MKPSNVSASVAMCCWSYLVFGVSPAYAQQTECNQFGTHAITVNGNTSAFIVGNNASGDCPTSGSNCQCISWNTNGTFSITKDPGAGPGQSGWGFPNILQGQSYGEATTNSGMPIQVKAVQDWPISWSLSGTSTGEWNGMVEFWATTYNPSNPTQCAAAKDGTCSSGHVTQADGAEILIWLSTSCNQTPAGQPVLGPSVIGGMTWNVYAVRGGPQSAYPDVRWNYIAYALQDPTGACNGIKNITSINMDFAQFFSDAETRVGPCQDGASSGPCLDPSWYITSVQAGFEFPGPGAGVGLNSGVFKSAVNSLGLVGTPCTSSATCEGTCFNRTCTGTVSVPRRVTCNSGGTPLVCDSDTACYCSSVDATGPCGCGPQNSQAFFSSCDGPAECPGGVCCYQRFTNFINGVDTVYAGDTKCAASVNNCLQDLTTDPAFPAQVVCDPSVSSPCPTGKTCRRNNAIAGYTCQ